MILRSVRYASTKVPVDDYTYCINHVRKVDYENFLCTAMLKPSTLQRPGMTLRALNVELSLIRDQVSNGQLGRMRLEFWNETIESIYASKNSNLPRKIHHPVARELDLLIRLNSLTKIWFQRLIKSREITLDDMPFHDLEQLETYLEQSITPTYYLLLELAQQRSLNTDHIASHLGRAQGLINIVRGVVYNAQKRRCFLPLSILVEHRVSQQDIFNGQLSTESVRHVIYDLCARSAFHLKKTIELYEKQTDKSSSNRTLFLPIILVYDYLKRIKHIDFDLTNQQIQQRNPWLHWNLWRRKYPTSNDLSSF